MPKMIVEDNGMSAPIPITPELKAHLAYIYEIVSREEAKAGGLIKYFTGKPCKRGHCCERLVRSWNCIECAKITKRQQYQNLSDVERDKRREKSRARMRRDRIRDPEKAREQQRRYRERHPERQRQYLAKNPEKWRAVAKKYRSQNAEYYRAYKRKYNAKISNLIAVLRKTMPELLKEFGL